MPVRAHLLRLLHLVQKLQAARGRQVPFAELQQHLLTHPSLDDLKGYDQRTFQRDMQEINDLFGLSIKYRRGQEPGHYIAGVDPLLPGHERLLEAVALQEFLQLPAALQPYVQPEARRAQGLAHLRPLLRAAQGRRVVEFEYQKYWEDGPETRTAGPLLLKEFRGRWYVLAVMVWSGRLACFGLDRIHHLRETGNAFELPAGFEAAGYYADTFGITRPHDAEPQEVVLRFEPVQGRYVLGYPLHHSQRVLVDDEAEIRLSLRVYLTHELYMELLSYGDSVEVLTPASLREWLQQGHRAAAG